MTNKSLTLADFEKMVSDIRLEELKDRASKVIREAIASGELGHEIDLNDAHGDAGESR